MLRDQREGRRKFEDLIKKMERLSQRFEKEGRSYAVDLLRKGLEYAQKQNLSGKMIEIEGYLREDSLWSSATKAEELVAELNKLLDILMDRQRLEKYERILSEIQEALEGLEGIQEVQSALLEQTRGIRREAGREGQRSLEGGGLEIFKQQEGLLARNWELQGALQERESLAADLSGVIGRQEELQGEVQKGLEGGGKEEGKWKNEQEGIRKEISRLGERGAGGEASKEFLDRMASAQEASIQAERGFEESRLDEVLETQERVLSNLKEGLDALKSNSFAKGLQELEKLQKGLAEKARQEARVLQEQRESGAGSSAGSAVRREEMARALEEGAASMRAAGQKLEEGRLREAEGFQEEALDRVREALEGFQRLWNPFTEEQKEEMKRLARKERALEEKTESLASKIKGGEMPFSDTQPLEEAKDHMSNASTSLEIHSPEDAEREMEESLKNLDEAGRKMSDQRDEFLGFQREELLFQLKEKLKTFKKKQDALNLDTKEIHSQETGGNYTRSQKISLRKVGEKQASLMGNVEEAHARVEKEGAAVFSWALKNVAVDMKEVAERLKGNPPDPGSYTQSIQEDISSDLQHLVDSFTFELDRRRSASGGQQGGG